MAAKDFYHDIFVRALQKDGWTITHDPLTLPFRNTSLLIDVGAEQPLAAERGTERIAVEIKSFIKLSPIQDLKEALGQYILYEDVLADLPEHSDRTLYLAVREEAFNDVFDNEPTLNILRRRNIRLIVFDPITEVILQWRN